MAQYTNNSKKQTNKQKTQAEDLKRHFSKDDII